MFRVADLNRRALLAGAAALISYPAAIERGSSRAFAQSGGVAADTLDHWRELGRLTQQSVKLGVSVPRMAAHINTMGDRDFIQIMPATVDLIASLEAHVARAQTRDAEIDALIAKACDLLRRVHQAERAPPDPRPEGLSIAAQPGRPSFESLKAGYRELFESSTVRDAHRATVDWYLSKLSDSPLQARWYEVAQEACCPWYFVAITHAMEGSFNFQSHLHNGDPLRERTVNVPQGRPKTWNPPSSWEASAFDALSFDGFVDVSDWTLERMLYRWESYNGFRSRQNGINTPYLWSFSNHYSRGKYIADNVWDPNAVSKQCGAAVMLKVLVERKLAVLPA